MGIFLVEGGGEEEKDEKEKEVDRGGREKEIKKNNAQIPKTKKYNIFI